jgi:hypothetical protein
MFIKSQYSYIGGKERMKVSRNPKTKPDAQDAIHLQVISENPNVECTVIAADSSLEKRKKEAEKPIYLKRI